MNCLFRACSAAILSRTSDVVGRSTWHGIAVHPWKLGFKNASIRTVNLELLLPQLRIQCYSSRKGSGSKSLARKSEPQPLMGEEKNSFFVVRKGDLVGVYRSLSECQAQVGSSICDPPVSVYKGDSMPKDTVEYLLSCGLKNALYSIKASDLKEDLFGPLVPCQFQLPPTSKGDPHSKDILEKRSQEVLGVETVEAVGSTSLLLDPATKYLKRTCILEFDGASKGNPGLAGAGAVLRADDGSVICRLQEGLGITTNNVAEYRAMILGMKYALKKGFTNIRVVGDSKLVCMQIQGLWRVRNKNISNWFNEAKKLKDKFLSFQISHVLRELNSEADAQANFAVRLADGQIQEIEM